MPVLIYRIEYEGGGTVPPSPHPARHPSCTPQSPELRDQSRTRTVSTPGVSSRDNPNPWGGDSHALSRNLTRVGPILTLTLYLRAYP